MVMPFFVRTDVKQEKVLKRVDPLQVARLTVEKNYTKIYLIDGTVYSSRISLVNALKYFPPHIFVKIDRAEVVSIFHIDDIAKDHLLIKGIPYNITRAYYKYVVAGIHIME